MLNNRVDKTPPQSEVLPTLLICLIFLCFGTDFIMVLCVVVKFNVCYCVCSASTGKHPALSREVTCNFRLP